MAEPEAGDGRLGSPRPALPPKVAESLDDAMLEKTLRPVLVEKKEQLVLLEERGMMLLSRGSRSRRFDLVRCLEDKGPSEEESDGVGAGGATASAGVRGAGPNRHHHLQGHLQRARLPPGPPRSARHRSLKVVKSLQPRTPTTR